MQTVTSKSFLKNFIELLFCFLFFVFFWILNFLARGSTCYITVELWSNFLANNEAAKFLKIELPSSSSSRKQVAGHIMALPIK